MATMVMVFSGSSFRSRSISLWAGVLLGVKNLEYEGGSTELVDSTGSSSNRVRQVSAGDR
jgi:hypothetical protein